VRLILLYVLLTGACSFNEPVCSEVGNLPDYDGTRWITNGFNIQVNGQGLGEYEKFLDVVLEDWNNLGAGFYLERTDGHHQVRLEAVQDEEYLGLTETWVYQDTQNISNVRVSLNTTLLDEYNDIGKRRVLCHEIGHALGLDHRVGQTCLDNCSYYPANSPQKKLCIENPQSMSPDEANKTQLLEMYGQCE
jgi:hypothetical protein